MVISPMITPRTAPIASNEIKVCDSSSISTSMPSVRIIILRQVGDVLHLECNGIARGLLRPSSRFESWRVRIFKENQIGRRKRDSIATKIQGWISLLPVWDTGQTIVHSKKDGHPVVITWKRIPWFTGCVGYVVDVRRLD